MIYKQYQDDAITTAIYLPETSLMYLVFGLMGEFGELVEKVLDAKSIVDNDGVVKESGDVCWYGAAICKDFDFDIDIIFGTSRVPEVLKEATTEAEMLEYGTQQVLSLGELIKKHLRDDYKGGGNFNNLTFERHAKLGEIVHNVIQTVRLIVSTHTRYQFEEVLAENVAKLKSRKDRGQLTGSGDYR